MTAAKAKLTKSEISVKCFNILIKLNDFVNPLQSG